MYGFLLCCMGIMLARVDILSEILLMSLIRHIYLKIIIGEIRK